MIEGINLRPNKTWAVAIICFPVEQQLPVG